MAYSYVGLVAAAAAEIVTRLPATRPQQGQGLAFGVAIFVASIIVFIAGSWLIRRGAAAAIAPFRQPSTKPPLAA
jgi:hypothetical protein